MPNWRTRKEGKRNSSVCVCVCGYTGTSLGMCMHSSNKDILNEAQLCIATWLQGTAAAITHSHARNWISTESAFGPPRGQDGMKCG